MKTTLEIPGALFRKAKVRAASNGQSLKALVTEALEDRLAKPAKADKAKPWLNVFKGLPRTAAFRADTARIKARIEEEFERLEPEDLE